MPQDAAATPPARSTVFISYSRSNRKWLDRLMTYLKPLEDLGITDIWADTRIAPGDLWRVEIDQALAAARVAILLVSIEFINSRFIAEVELPALLQAAETDGVLILQVFVGHCANRYNRTPRLNGFQAVNPPSNPLSSMTSDSRDQLWDELAARVEDALAGSG